MSSKSKADITPHVRNGDHTEKKLVSEPLCENKKRIWEEHGAQHGRSQKRADVGRSEPARQGQDKRVRNAAEAGRRRINNAGYDNLGTQRYSSTFSREEIAKEDRRPKRKVAVLVGYCGSGYKGMQINTKERTIEGDLFDAFIKSGAISKANADDPKKSGLVRCARTDKGVHAAGNVISLKLIVEDSSIVERINEYLAPQIRVWGIERTIGSFNCYQACDSRWYEYMIPTFSFLPPHPSTSLGRKLVQIADEVKARMKYDERQLDVACFWQEAEQNYIQPVMKDFDSETRKLAQEVLYREIAECGRSAAVLEVETDRSVSRNAVIGEDGRNPVLMESEEAHGHGNLPPDAGDGLFDSQELSRETSRVSGATEASLKEDQTLEVAVKLLKSAYIAAKRSYRIHAGRLEQIREVLSRYEGTHNFHNFTVQKPFNDPSSNRLIKSFTISKTPVIVNDTEWLSLKVHGQSFMMHQIRKMVAMAALVVRCGCPPSRIDESLTELKISIPKAPGLGLLLERPVFDTYNHRTAAKFSREKIDFERYEKEMGEFKQKEIYERIFREEDSGNHFHSFFSAIDNHKMSHFHYLTSAGVSASTGTTTHSSLG